jgi:activating signal cointegrator complex subunit 3/antiviral helicase SLH1
MILFDETTGYLTPKDLGRIAANFYIGQESIDIVNKSLTPTSTEADVLAVVSLCREFDNLKVRDPELRELDRLLADGYCPCQINLGPEHVAGKVNILLQSYISRAELSDFSLVSDMSYISQNAPRILRALFDVALKRHWGSLVLSSCHCANQWKGDYGVLSIR